MSTTDSEHESESGSTAAQATFETIERDGKTYASVADLENWEDNPRTASDEEIDRLADEIEDLGFYKPLIVNHAGEVLGGNMRLRALGQLDRDDAWVSIVDASTHDEKLAYALSDNDRVGSYEEDKLADLIAESSIDIENFKVDFYSPQDLTDSMSRVLDPEDLASNLPSVDEPEPEPELIEDEPPDFDPVDEDEQPRLDERDFTPVKCPECNELFNPNSHMLD